MNEIIGEIFWGITVTGLIFLWALFLTDLFRTGNGDDN
jgi:hypothetical protein